MPIKFDYVNTEEKLLAATKQMRKVSVLGVDLECENNLHHYGSRLALIQVSDSKQHWLIDVLCIDDLQTFFSILTDASIVKIFHDVDFDFRILYHEFHIRVHNVFDTQIAAALLGKTELGLGALLTEYFHAKKECKYQMADWLKRPLDGDMMEYAIKDTVYLVQLREIFLAEARKLNREAWILEECAYLEKKEYSYHEQEYIDVRGVKGMTDQERSVFKELFFAREKLAQKVDKPIHFVINTKRLIQFAQHPLSLKQWQTVKGVHPAVRSHAQWFFDATQKGLKGKDVYVSPKRLSFKPQQKKFIQDFTELRDHHAQQLELPPHLLASKEQIKQIAISGKYDGLRDWQRKILLND